MKQFNVTYPSGLIDMETVCDCDTIEAYANRKFGSVNYKEFGAEIEMIDLDRPDPAPVEQKETITTPISSVQGTATEVVRNIVMPVDSLEVGSKLS